MLRWRTPLQRGLPPATHGQTRLANADEWIHLGTARALARTGSIRHGSIIKSQKKNQSLEAAAQYTVEHTLCVAASVQAWLVITMGKKHRC